MLSRVFEIVPRPANLEGETCWVLFHQDRLLLKRGDLEQGFPTENVHRWLSDEPLREHYLGRLGGAHCVAVALPNECEIPEGYEALGLRQLVGVFDEHRFSVVSRAKQLLTWYSNHQFCSRCGNATRLHQRDAAMICSVCEYTQYPRITPCVIMLVRREQRVLLAHSARFTTPMFSCLAGFMEAGETAEDAVRREVYEETGIRVTDLRYHASQSWPFPHALMLAFSAEYESGEIRLDDEEITEADWFAPDELPLIPPQGSIARTLIDDWLADVQQEKGSGL